MKKCTEKMVTLIAAFILMCAMTGCGQANVDQGEVDTTLPKENDPSLPGAGGGEGGDVLDNNKGKGGGDDKGGDDKPADPSGGGDTPSP